MDYEIYNLIYDLGIMAFQEAVVSTNSHDGAAEMLKRHLDKNYFKKEGTCDSIGFNVRIVSSTGVKTDIEKVLSPFISKDLEYMVSEISRQQ